MSLAALGLPQQYIATIIVNDVNIEELGQQVYHQNIRATKG